MAFHLTRPGPLRSPPRWLLFGLAGGIVFGLAGPFGTYAAPFWPRMAYAMVLMVLGSALGTGVADQVGRMGSMRTRPWLASLVICLSVGLPFTVVVWGVTGWFFMGGARLENLPSFIGPVLLVSAAMTVIGGLMKSRAAQAKAAQAAQAAPPVHVFANRLPPRLRDAELLAVQSEDHYLRVHTVEGSALILMRLSDAIAELAQVEGARTHRSWWVARSAITDVARGDGRATLTLKGGLAVPVSRSFAPGLRDRGWY